MKRKSLRTLTMASTAIVLTSAIGAAFAQVPPPPASRTPQPWPGTAGYNYQTSADGLTTTITTPQGGFPASDPYVNPTNLLPNVYDNVKTEDGNYVPNTLSSSPQHPYNLHPDPVITQIDKTSPTDDLAAIFSKWRRRDGGDGFSGENFSQNDVQRALDILEGNPVPNRVYSGIPMIHYNGPNKKQAITPDYDASGKLIGGHVTIHQVWFDTHIESDTAFLDPSAVLSVPFTITYVIDTLSKGHDDFAPMQMYLDPTHINPATGQPQTIPLVTMDMTFFPMEEGTRTTYQLGLAPGKNFNLTYHWGWRRHPPRVQVTENAVKPVMGVSTWQWEVNTFGANPRASQAAKEAAIAMISDLAPSKRMWVAFRSLQQNGFNPAVVAQAKRAFEQWGQRNQLPDGVTADPNADITLFYADNTIYGQMKDYVVSPNAQPVLDKWHARPVTATIKLLNGDYFEHGYISVDFGGMRGYENTFQNTLPVGGDGAFFTFGRAWWEMNTPTPILVPPATPLATPAPPTPVPPARHPDIDNHKVFWLVEDDPEGKTLPKRYPKPTLPAPMETLGEHTVVLNLNYEPSLRLRLYQFDPLHHEQAIWSVH